ncbi:hypothetical protein D3C86_1178290 [compost metagenome]
MMVLPAGKLMTPELSTNAELEERKVTLSLSRSPAGLLMVIRNKDLDTGISFPSEMLAGLIKGLCT